MRLYSPAISGDADIEGELQFLWSFILRHEDVGIRYRLAPIDADAL